MWAKLRTSPEFRMSDPVIPPGTPPPGYPLVQVRFGSCGVAPMELVPVDAMRRGQNIMIFIAVPSRDDSTTMIRTITDLAS